MVQRAVCELVKSFFKIIIYSLEGKSSKKKKKKGGHEGLSKL